MISPLADVFPATLIATWTAWLYAALIYGALRWGEKQWAALPYWGLVPLAAYFGYEVVPWLRMYPVATNEELIHFGTHGVVALLGGFFHRRSSGASRHWLGAFLLMFEAVTLSVEPVASATERILVVSRTVPEPAIWAWMAGISLYPAFVPLAIWIWQSMRIRQGVDVPNEDE